MAEHMWKKHLATALACGLLAFNAVALAAPIELSLDESIALALKNNPSVKIAEADKAKAEWTVKAAEAGNGPTFSYAHTDTRLQSVPSLLQPNPYVTKYDNNASLKLYLYTGGKVESAINQAKIGFTVADLDVTRARQQLRLDATTAYFGVLQARNLVKISQDSVDSLAAHLKNVQAQYDVGTVAKSDVLRSEVELANAQQSLIKAQNSYDLAMASLNNVLGLPLDSQVSIKEELAYAKYPLPLESAIKYAMGNRPEVAQTAAAIQSAREGVKYAKSGHLPAVALTGYEDWNDRDFPGAKNNNWGVSLTTQLNVFDAGLTDAQVKQAESGVGKAEEQARQTRDAVSLDVRQQYLSMQEAEKRIQTSKVAVDKAEEDFKIAQVRYNAGVGTNLDVIDAQVALNQAKTNYVQALYDFNTSKAKLEKAMGTSVK
jgi:TolC family type I secretion outer membrane protein